MAALYRSDRKFRIGREVEMMIVYILFLLLVNQAHAYTKSESEVKHCNPSTVININNHGQTEIILNLTEVKGEGLVYINTPVGEPLFYGPKDKMTIASKPENHFNILFNDKSTLKLGVRDIHKQLAGSYCFLEGTEVILECSRLLQVADKPQVNLTVPTTSPILQVTSNNILQGGITLNCSARSTSKPDHHNLTMVYGWFIDGMFTRSTSPTLDITLTVGQNDVICVATDYPICGELLNNTSRTTDIKKVKENVRCENVLGESSPLKIIPEYGPYQINLRPSRSEIKKKLSEKLQVKCDVKCNPPCKVRWLRDEGDVDDDEDDDESILYIDKVEEDDGGEYTCTATNIHGDLNSSFTLNLTGEVTPVTLSLTDPIAVQSSVSNKTIATVFVGDSGEDGGAVTAVVVVLLILTVIVVIAVLVWRRNHLKSCATNYFTSQRIEFTPNNRRSLVAEEYIVYADLDLPAYTRNPIHGACNSGFIYDTIDFTKKAPPLPPSLEVDSSDEDWG